MGSWTTWTYGPVECWRRRLMDPVRSFRRSSGTSLIASEQATGFGLRTTDRTGTTSLLTHFNVFLRCLYAALCDKSDELFTLRNQPQLRGHILNTPRRNNHDGQDFLNVG